MPQLVQILESAWPPGQWADVHVLVAVSGGPDSMALLRAILALKHRHGGLGQIFALHVNHQIHSAADADEAWVVGQLQDLGVAHEVRRVDTRSEAARQGDGLEAAARTLRYRALQTAAEERGARYVALGHTADDQVETVLQRVIRGTGVEGLAGMPRQRPLGPTATLVRPMLEVTRQHVLDYLAGLEQPFREDPTNWDAAYTRNHIRQELLPLLRSRYNSGVDEAILRLARQAEEIRAVVRSQVNEIVARAVRVKPDRIELIVPQLRLVPEPLVREVVRIAWRSAGWPEQEMSDSAWRRLGRLPHAEPTRFHLPGGVEAIVSREMIALLRGGP